MYCPGCGLQANDDLKFCRQCGANLRGVREAMTSNPTEEKFDWSKSWAANILLAQEVQERQRGTPEERRLNEIKGGVITSFVGIGVMLFLYFFFDMVAKGKGDDAGGEILRIIWLAGIIPFLIGISLIFNGLFVSRRLVKLKEQQAQSAPPAPPTPTAHPTPPPAALPAKTTDQLIVDAAPPVGYSVIEDTTAHLPEPVAAPPRRETG